MLHYSESSESVEFQKNSAINSVQQWIILSWVLAFLVIIVLPWVLGQALSNASDAQKATTTFLIGILMNVVYWIVATSRIKESVSTAIEVSARFKADLARKQLEHEYEEKLKELDTTCNSYRELCEQKIQEYRRDHPSIEDFEERIWRDFRCLIPKAVRHEDLVEVSERACREQKIRDSIYTALAYEDDLLSGIVYSFIQFNFANELGHNDDFPEIYGILHTDLFAFLKAWLMFSIRHSIFMPVEYIMLRFPATENPDFSTYEAAFIYFKEVFREEDLVLEKFHKDMREDCSRSIIEHLDFLIYKIREKVSTEKE